MNAYIIKPCDVMISLTRSYERLPLEFSATPIGKDSLPVGLVAFKGELYGKLTLNTPLLIRYNEGGMEITTDVSAKEVAFADFVVEGNCILTFKGKRYILGRNTEYKKSIDRVAIGLLSSGEVMTLHMKGTMYELQNYMHTLGAYSSMATTSNEDDVYLYNPRGGVDMGNKPMVTLGAEKYKDFPKPIIVIDAGHGGDDPGAVGEILYEKDMNLFGADAMQSYLNENYEGTFLLTRSTDTYLSLKERTDMANAIGADFFFSCHCNGSTNKVASGYSTFVNDVCSQTSKDVQKAVHTETMKLLERQGIKDRGMQSKNLHVLRESKMPAVLCEMLFITCPEDELIMNNRTLMLSAYQAQAIGIAKALGLQKRVYADESALKDKEYYRVQIGAFRFKAGAQELAGKLKALGFETYVTKY